MNTFHMKILRMNYDIIYVCVCAYMYVCVCAYVCVSMCTYMHTCVYIRGGYNNQTSDIFLGYSKCFDYVQYVNVNSVIKTISDDMAFVQSESYTICHESFEAEKVS